MGVRGPKPRRKEVVWSNDFAYAIGLITTDGCLSSDGRHLEFTSKDLEQVENLRRCLGITAKVAEKGNGRGGHVYHVQWGDVVLYKFLLTIGLTPKKSKTIGEINVPVEFFGAFLRGHFDGDGCFYSYFDPRWKDSFMFYVVFTSASLDHITWLREVLMIRLGVKGHVTFTRIGTVPSLRFAKAEGLRVIDAMYADSGPSLARKRLKIKAAMRIVEASSQAKARI